ncbi:hypothetical protein [Metabacillus rhizolycopersici]|uniref:Yip1 domain-containing protein n=1 Tax=Metabacillus rhizolycopersici TaxID=2875709 RepID=A0ABS7UYA2_9BACI|nr:hypothetical protein [Metabacillus rhizolycopersici]MBZ5753298.1 hypothetical protein [Metabacillus rhizolycopersici]
MIYRMHVVKGLFQPETSLYQLQKAEAFSGIGLKLILLYLLSFIIFAASTYFGIGTETYSGTITERTNEEFEAGKLLLLGGRLVLSLLDTTLFIWFAAFVFWLCLNVDYIKAVIVQMIVFSIYLAEQAITSLVLVLFDLNQASNPFSFGVISQYFIRNEYWNHFFGAMTLFQFAAISLLYYYLKNLTGRNKYLTLTVILVVYVITWLFTALTAYIEVPVLLRRWF